MYKIEMNKIFNGNACIYTAIGKILSYLEVERDIIICYNLQGMEPNDYMRIPHRECLETVLRINERGEQVWRISGGKDAQFTYVYIDKFGNYRAMTGGHEIYYFDPETGKTDGWDYDLNRAP